jgi:ABC-type nitrate/sulfonate/bicarbonate transport system permease component
MLAAAPPIADNKHPSGSPKSSSFPRAVLPATLVAGVLAVIELLARSGPTSRQYFPPVSDVFVRLAEVSGSSVLWIAVGNTLLGIAAGLSIAATIGIPAGVLIGSSTWLNRATKVTIEFLRPVPSVALVPLAILLYGNGLASKIFLVAYAALWPILVQTIYGMRDIDPVATDTARSFNFTKLQRLILVSGPCALPYALTGLRIAVAIAVMLAVTAELIIGSPGLGKEISLARQVGDVSGMYAAIVATGALGWTLNAILVRLERRVLFWHQAYRAVEGEA